MRDVSPTARALLVLELIQNTPGISADRLAERLGVSERAVRRHVGILREAGLPIDSVRGPYGGYRIGRGFRLPPLMFSISEGLGLVMAVLAGGHGGAGSADPVGRALGKLIRVLPESVAGPTEAFRRMSARGPEPGAVSADPHTIAALGQAGSTGRRLRLRYRMGPDREREMDVDPWAVVVRHGRWYLLCWSHTKDARRVLRVDRIAGVETLAQEFTAPTDLDPVRAIEEQFSQGWRYEVEVHIDASAERVAGWIPASLGRLEVIDADHSRLLATTDEPDWYAEHLAGIRAPFRIHKSRELRDAARALSERLSAAAKD